MNWKLINKITIWDKEIPEGTILNVIGDACIYKFDDGLEQTIPLDFLEKNAIKLDSITTTEINNDSLNQKKRWRMNLDISCTFEEMKKLEEHLNVEIHKFLTI